MIKFTCNDCGADAEYKFDWKFVHVDNETNIPSPSNSSEDYHHSCEDCKNQIMMFLLTRKSWIND